MRLIDSDAAYERAQADLCRGGLEDWEFDMIVNLLDSAPTVDAASVVRGRWEEADWVELDGGGNELIRTPNAALRCSICRNCFKKELLWKGTYCPSCGAKMDGGDPDGR